MQLVQWIVPRSDGGFAVLFSPVWTEEVPGLRAAKARKGGGEGASLVGRVRRRSAPLSSRWLPHPMAVAEADDTPRVEGPPLDRPVGLRFEFATSDRGPPVAMMRDDDIAFSSLFAEMVGVVADLCEGASLPVLALLPDAERRGLDVVLGSLVMLPAQTAFDALCVVHAAVDLCAQQRGFLVASATVSVGAGKTLAHAPMDARAAPLFAKGSAKGRP